MTERRVSTLAQPGSEALRERLQRLDDRVAELERAVHQPFPGWSLRRVGPAGEGQKLQFLYVPTGTATTIAVA